MNSINNQAGHIRSGRITTEGDELYYEVRGQGQPFLMIPAGEGKYYAAVADLLADEYKVITYDRRANGRSTMNNPQNFEISQQSRDAVAVLRAVDETSAFVFGNSTGAVVALDMAKTQPQAVRAVVAHEAPLSRVLPNARKWQRFFARVYLTAFRFGSSLAGLQFILGAQLPILKIMKAASKAKQYGEGSDEPRISEKDAADVQIKLELLPVTSYLPDVELIKRNGVTVFMAAGTWGLKKKAWYAQAARLLAEQLGCELVPFPGHHGSFGDMPEEWAATLRSLFHKAEATSR
ncbi:MAG: alpha/beta hydrolase [Ktedonobacteraceae bacterium]|nr:alpha/beta hydrolase [Ktedonobacteraceae bacterium]